MADGHFSITPDGAAHWVPPAEPPEDDDLLADDYFEGPTQEELCDFVAQHRAQLKTLNITTESVLSQPLLDFRAAGPFPNLVELYLRFVHLTSLSLSAADMPRLQRMFLSVPSGPCEAPVFLDFALPELRHLGIEHCLPAAPTDFGFCLSRCPKLETFASFKLSLYGPNHMVLPNCRKFVVTRSELVKSLQILSAPKLTQVDVSDCWSLTDFRVWDLNKPITPQEVKRLNAARRYGPKRVRTAREKLMKALLSRPDAYDPSSVPECKVYHCHVELSEQSKAEAEGSRVQLTEEGGQMYYGDGLYWMGENLGYGSEAVRTTREQALALGMLFAEYA